MEDRFQGFKRTSLSIQLDDGLLLIEPGAAAAYEQRLKDEAEAAELAEMARKKALEDAHKQVWTPEQLPDLQGKVVQTSVQQPDAWKPSPVKEVKKPTQEQMPFARPVEFFGNIDIPAATAKKRLVEIADEVIALLAKDPKATVRINLSIDAEFPEGADEQLRRAVSENVKTLGFKDGRWE